MGGPPGAQDPVGGWTVISVLVATQTCYLLLSRCWQGPAPHRTGKAMGMIPGLDLEPVRPGLGVGGRSGEHVEGGTLRPQGREVWKGLSRGQGSGQGCVGARKAFHVTGSCCRTSVGELARLSHSHFDPCLQANASASIGIASHVECAHCWDDEGRGRGADNQVCQPENATQCPCCHSSSCLLAPAVPTVHDSLVDRLDALRWPLSLRRTLSTSLCPQEMPKLGSQWSTGRLHKCREPAALEPKSLCPDHLAEVGGRTVFTEQS